MQDGWSRCVGGQRIGFRRRARTALADPVGEPAGGAAQIALVGQVGLEFVESQRDVVPACRPGRGTVTATIRRRRSSASVGSRWRWCMSAASLAIHRRTDQTVARGRSRGVFLDLAVTGNPLPGTPRKRATPAAKVPPGEQSPTAAAQRSAARRAVSADATAGTSRPFDSRAIVWRPMGILPVTMMALPERPRRRPARRAVRIRGRGGQAAEPLCPGWMSSGNPPLAGKVSGSYIALLCGRREPPAHEV